VIDVEWGTATDCGLIRTVNEDSLLASPPVFLVADGMGGYQAGDTASAIVVEEFTIAPGIERVTPEWVMHSFDRADSRIRYGAGGGTTVAGIAVVQQDSNPYWLVFNIGDSRVYRCVQGRLTQVSVDHSVVQELVDEGKIAAESARFHPERHVITRAVGSSEPPHPDFWLLPAEVGERLLLCSDGLSSEVDEDDIAQTLAGFGTPHEIANALVAQAISAGGRDNVTAIVVDVIAVGKDVLGEHIVTVDGVDPGVVDDATRPRIRTVQPMPGEGLPT
jgi:serine/threonine protein phosphatase PrpC